MQTKLTVTVFVIQKTVSFVNWHFISVGCPWNSKKIYFLIVSDGDYRLKVRILVEVIHIPAYFMFLFFVCLVALCNLYFIRNHF